METEHEIIICGAGMVGLTFALLMSEKKIKVCLLEKNKISQLFKQNDTRTTAISQGSSRIYDQIGIWKGLKQNAQPIHKILVADGEADKDLEFDHTNLDQGPLGFIVNNKFLKNKLLNKAIKSKFITFHDNTEISEIKNEDINESYITTSKGEIKYKLLVAADGRFSKTRYHANIKYFFHDYKQNAFVFNISHEKAHRGIALERFFPTGPMALLPIKDKKANRSSVVWTVDSIISNDKEFQKNFKKEFLKNYNNFFGKIKDLSSINFYPLNIYSCYECCNKNVVLIGDACQAIHPIAGQGFNLGLRDAKYLSDVISEFSQSGLEPFNKNLISIYKNKRFLDKTFLVATTHNLNSLFSNSNQFIHFARKLGLKIFSKSNLLKNQSMLFAMGLKNLEL